MITIAGGILLAVAALAVLGFVMGALVACAESVGLWFNDPANERSARVIVIVVLISVAVAVVVVWGLISWQSLVGFGGGTVACVAIGVGYVRLITWANRRFPRRDGRSW